MTPEHAKTLLDPKMVTGRLALYAHHKSKAYEIWVWKDEHGVELVTKRIGNREFGWRPHLTEPSRSYTAERKLKRVSTRSEPSSETGG